MKTTVTSNPENPGEAFWAAINEPGPSGGPFHREFIYSWSADSQADLEPDDAAKLLAFCETVPGWSDGPGHPLIFREPTKLKKIVHGWYSPGHAKTCTTFTQRDTSRNMQVCSFFCDSSIEPPAGSKWGDEVYIGEFSRYGDTLRSDANDNAIRSFWKRDGDAPLGRDENGRPYTLSPEPYASDYRNADVATLEPASGPPEEMKARITHVERVGHHKHGECYEVDRSDGSREHVALSNALASRPSLRHCFDQADVKCLGHIATGRAYGADRKQRHNAACKVLGLTDEADA